LTLSCPVGSALGSNPAAMEFLGHSNIETTALYLAADDTNLEKTRNIMDEMFEAGD
jgi:hypothetical protein